MLCTKCTVLPSPTSQQPTAPSTRYVRGAAAKRERVGGVSSGGWPSGALPKGKKERRRGGERGGGGGREIWDPAMVSGAEPHPTLARGSAGYVPQRRPTGCLGSESANLTLRWLFRDCFYLFHFFPPSLFFSFAGTNSIRARWVGAAMPAVCRVPPVAARQGCPGHCSPPERRHPGRRRGRHLGQIF